jgi:hypothetical protein
MFTHLHHAIRTSGDKAQPGVIGFTPEQKGRVACADSVPVGVAGAEVQLVLQVLEALARPENSSVQQARRHKDRLLSVKLEVDLDDRAHCAFLPTKPRQNLVGKQLSPTVQNYASLDRPKNSAVRRATSSGAPYAQAQNRKEQS